MAPVGALSLLSLSWLTGTSFCPDQGQVRCLGSLADNGLDMQRQAVGPYSHCVCTLEETPVLCQVIPIIPGQIVSTEAVVCVLSIIVKVPRPQKVVVSLGS